MHCRLWKYWGWIAQVATELPATTVKTTNTKTLCWSCQLHIFSHFDRWPQIWHGTYTSAIWKIHSYRPGRQKRWCCRHAEKTGQRDCHGTRPRHRRMISNYCCGWKLHRSRTLKEIQSYWCRFGTEAKDGLTEPDEPKLFSKSCWQSRGSHWTDGCQKQIFKAVLHWTWKTAAATSNKYWYLHRKDVANARTSSNRSAVSSYDQPVIYQNAAKQN